MIICKNTRTGIITIAEGKNNRDYTVLYKSQDKQKIKEYIDNKL